MMENKDQALLPYVQETQVQPPIDQPAVYHQQQQVPVGQPTTSTPGQPIMYQMAPGQQQPVFTQVPTGQPATTLEGQPFQYYYVPVGQPVQPGQPAQLGQPVFVQGVPGQRVQPKQSPFVQGDSDQPAQPGQYVQPGQPMFVQGVAGPPARPGQQVFVQGAPGQPVQSRHQVGEGGFQLIIDTEFLMSPPCFIKTAEFVTLLGAWASILKYFDMSSKIPFLKDDEASVFEGIMIFSWVVVILYMIICTFSFPKIWKCKQPSIFTITSVFFHFILFSLLLACTGNLVPRAVDFGKEFKLLPSEVTDEVKPYFIALNVALAFGFLSCILFVVDMVLNYRLFQTQRAQEIPPDQGPPQRLVWDINQEYLRSKLFFVKLVEMGLLFGAWVCILKYFDMDMIKLAQSLPWRLYTSQPNLDLSKEEFFRGITIFSWVMVILLALTFLFSFDKICSRSSPWTLATFSFYIFLSILLMACCGNLTPLAIKYGNDYGAMLTSEKPNVVALFIGLAFGYIAWLMFIVDICLLFDLYRQQRMQEFPSSAGEFPHRVIVRSHNKT